MPRILVTGGAAAPRAMGACTTILLTLLLWGWQAASTATANENGVQNGATTTSQRLGDSVGPPLARDPIFVYNNWSAYDELSDNIPLTEQLAMKELDEILRLRRFGVRFDYYMMDAFWFDPDGGYRTWRKPNWPNGPDAWIRKCRKNGILPGLWFSTNTLVKINAAPEWQNSLTHSEFATACAQACKPIPCFGTTHADSFHGEVPVTRCLTRDEIVSDYEKNTGSVICLHFNEVDPDAVPAVLVAGHGPFCWGASAAAAAHNAVILESVARIAYYTLTISPDAQLIASHLRDKHFLRKHGKDAYYGQEKTQ